MSRSIAFPFLVLPDEAIKLDQWMIGDPNQPLEPAADIFEHWDYARDLEVTSALEVNWECVSEALAFPVEDIRLRVSLIAGTGTGVLPRQQHRVFQRTLDASTGKVEVAAIIPGHKLSGRLKLTLQVTLEAPLHSGSDLSPKIRGARLWQNVHDILLEDGGDSRFPIEVVSFSEVFKGRPQENSPWYLHWRRSSVRADFSGTVRLYVNSDFQESTSRVVAGDELTLQAIMGDVISQMIESALDEKDADDLSDAEEGSVGRQIVKWLDAAFPGQELNSIESLRKSNPGAFRAAILASSNMGSAE